MDTVINFIRFIETLNFNSTFSDLISKKCKIKSKFNGKKLIKMDKTEFMNNLINGHFKNTTKVEVIFLSVEKIIQNGKEVFVLNEVANFHKTEKDEIVVYNIKSTGIIRIENNKIIDMDWLFTKKKN